MRYWYWQYNLRVLLTTSKTCVCTNMCAFKLYKYVLLGLASIQACRRTYTFDDSVERKYGEVGWENGENTSGKEKAKKHSMQN